MRIAIIQMGGTIDKVYPQEPNAYGFIISDAQSITLLNRWKLVDAFDHYSIAMKDSQDLTGEDLRTLLDFIITSDYEGYLITHGTDTIYQTGEFLLKGLEDIEKNIVVTGSRLPASVIASDAGLNLGMSIGVLQCDQIGVNIVLDGTIKKVQ